MTRKLETVFVDGNGDKVMVEVEIDETRLLEKAARGLTNRARRNPKRVAKALNGAIKVTIVLDEAPLFGHCSTCHRDDVLLVAKSQGGGLTRHDDKNGIACKANRSGGAA